LARSSPRRPPAAPSRPAASAVADPRGTLPRVWQGVEYRGLDDLDMARELFEFAAVAWPADPAPGWALGAWADGHHLVGAVVAERAGAAALLHGPVVVESRLGEPGGTTSPPLEVATQLVSATVDTATAAGVETVFVRPQGLDRVWVRFGFIPTPEGALPEALRGRPGAGLFAYRGGSALWSPRIDAVREDAPRDPRREPSQGDPTAAPGPLAPAPVRRRRSARKAS
jgi:hypothetical protein